MGERIHAKVQARIMALVDMYAKCGILLKVEEVISF